MPLFLRDNFFKRLSFCILLVMLPLAAKASNSAKQDDLFVLTAYEQARLIANQEITSEQLVKAYLNRIAQLDRNGPRVQAILALNPQALEQAKQKDKALKAGAKIGQLHGVPILIKDNIETKELPTTAGSMALLNNNTGRDAPIVARLRAEGAIILGKTNLSEWANFRDSDSISGWSAVGGQTRNPHSLDRTPCGSSSGSGAAIAAQFAPLALGTETNGSIICPSTMNGIVGVKPTVGLLSRTHIVPISVTQDTAGPMTRSVKDAALLLNIMAGTDGNDPATFLADEKKQDYLAHLDKSIAGKRVGVMRSAQSSHPEVIEAFDQALETLKSKGAILIEIDQVATPDGFWDKSLQVLLIEFKHELNAYLSSTPKTIKNRTLAQLIKFNADTPRQLALFEQSLFVDAQATKGYDDEYQTLVKFLREATRDNGIDKILNDNQVDFLVSPSQTPAFLIDAVYGDSFPGGFAGIGWMAAISGYPHVSVPMGDMKGLPLGLSFIAGEYDEALLLNAAYQYEQASKKIMQASFALGPIDQAKLKTVVRPLQ